MSELVQVVFPGRFNEDDYYDLVKSFLTEGSSMVGTAYLEGGVFMDPNSGRRLSDDIKGWDASKFQDFFRRWGVDHIVVRDQMGRLRPGEYAPRQLVKQLAQPKPGNVVPIVQGQRTEGLSLQDALLDNEWSEDR